MSCYISPSETHLSHTRADLLLIGELLVSCSPRVDSQGLGVTNVGQVGNQLEAVDNLATSGTATLDAEAEDTAKAALQVLLRKLVRGVVGQARVGHPADVRALLEELGQGQCVGGVPLSTQAQGLDTEEQLLGSEGVQAGAQVSEDLDTDSDDEGDSAEGLPELEPVVALRGLDHLGETAGVLAPVELAAVNDDASNGSTVAANPLGGGVDDDICAMLDGSDEVSTCTEGVVDLKHISYQSLPLVIVLVTYNDWYTLLVCYLGDSLEVGDVVLGVSNALEVDSLGLVIDGSGDILGLVAVDELGVDAISGQHDLELVVSATVQVGGGDNVVSSLGKCRNSHQLSGLARGSGHSGHTTLKGSNSLLEDIHSRLTAVVSNGDCQAIGSYFNHNLFL